MNSDFRDLLRLLNEKNAKYLIVGGYAVIKYTEPRYTGDIDIWIEASRENASKVYSALKDFGAPVTTLTEADFASPGFFFQMGVPPNRIDILMSVSGLKFSDAWNRRVSSQIESDSFYFISEQDLVTNKKAVNRPKDLADLESLNKSNKK